MNVREIKIKGFGGLTTAGAPPIDTNRLGNELGQVGDGFSREVVDFRQIKTCALNSVLVFSASKCWYMWATYTAAMKKSKEM